MAIQSRRGAYGDFDPDKMLPGEWASVLKDDPKAQDGKAVYMCFSAGDVKRMATYEDMKNNIQEATAEIIKQAKEEVTEDTKAAKESAAQAESSAKTAEEKASAAEKSASNAEKSAEASKTALESANKNFSDQYTKKTYKKGETCIQNNVLYEANADINTAEDWNTAHWAETSVEKIRAKMRQELDTVNTKIANITPDDTAVDGKPWTSKHIVDMLCPPLKVSGNPVQCYPVEEYPLGITASWEPTQEGTGDPSPENIRPIKGRDSVTVWRYGQNLLNYEAFKKTLVTRGTAVFENNGVTLTASENDCYTERTVKDGFPKECKIPVVNGEIITVSWATESNKNGKVFIFPNGDTPGMVSIDNANGKSISYTVEAGVSFVTFRFGVANAGDTISYKNIQCTIGSEAPTEYQPYTGDTTTLTLPETIYGGSADAVSGQGQKEWNIINLNDSIYVFKEQGYYVLNIPTLGGVSVEKPDVSLAYCSHYPQSAKAVNGYGFYMRIMGNGFVIFDSRFSTPAELQAYFKEQYAAGTPIRAAYKLNAPTSFAATGNEPVKALSGVNTVLTDADSAEVTGREDLPHAIAGQ